MRGAIAIAGLVASIGCVQPGVIECGDGTSCPGGYSCSESFGCISPDQFAACTGLDDGAACNVTALGDGVCVGGACIVARCGNALLEPPEACDDANASDGDGCSSSCRSTEVCGNGIVDPVTIANGTLVANEQCDDGDALSHDGCASCGLEEPRWSFDNEVMLGRVNAPIAYDAARGRIVMFGGFVSGRAIDETWLWDGAVWSRATPRRSPPSRGNHALAYDAARQTIVVFGATDGVGSPDTWTWDGGNWNQQFPDQAPPVRFQTALAYDAARGRTVLFGGQQEFTELADTWEWDGVTWHEVQVASSPPARRLHALAYDPVRARVVLFGGLSASGTALDDTWEFDGTAWSQIVSAAPPARSKPGMAFDPAYGVVLYGGTDAGNSTLRDTWTWDGAEWQQLAATGATGLGRYALAFDIARARLVLQGLDHRDTWEWNGTQWVNIPEPSLPPPRFNPALAYDAGRGQVVLFGGTDDRLAGADDDVLFGDTWEWNGGSWIERLPASSPSPRRGHSITYDAKRARTVLYGGVDAASVFTDTWEWDGTNWEQRAPVTSPGHQGILAYDAARERTILLGGTDASGNAETWIWDGTEWSNATPTLSPRARSAPTMTYDPIRRGVLLIGGIVSQPTRDLEDVWLWDGATWTELPITAPPRRQAALAFDLARGHAVLFGGSRTDETWELAGTSFQFLSTPVSPPDRLQGGLAYHAARRTVMSFGGEDNALTFGDTWRFRYESTLADESCLYGFDSDRDGLTGCDDPDCRGLCDPVCEIGGSCDAADRPRCGDGTCGPLETCRMCPGDCGECPVRCGDFVCDAGESALTCPGDCAQ